MYREVRRKDREITQTDAVAILQNGEYGILCMAGENGGGYGVPLSYSYVDGKIYFHCAVEGRKNEAFAKDNRVTFCVVGKTKVMPEKFGTQYESAMAFGRVQEVTGEEKEHALVTILEKYSPEYLEKGMLYIHSKIDRTKVFCLRPEHLSAKARRV